MRLVVERDGRPERRFPLTDGDTLIGKSAECDVTIDAVSVSRRHARLRIEGDRIEIEDLGSSNGTRLEGRPVVATTTVELGQSLSFGGVPARVEEVAPAEGELAVALSAPPPSEPRPESSPGSTAWVGSVPEFALRHLPSILDGLARDDGPVAVGQQVGEALMETLQCPSLEVAVTAGENEAVAFSAGDGADDGPGAIEERYGGATVRAVFVHSNHAQAYAPLLRAGATLVHLAHDRPRPEPPAATPEPPLPPAPSSRVEAVRRLYADAVRVAQGEVSVLILGESGTGKEVLARYLHAASPRADRPFVALNGAALPEALLEAELFGVERGTATGVEARPGQFELAHGGTLFLDEIGDMAPSTQAKILRVLQDRKVHRLGGISARDADVRVVAATNRDLDAAVEAGHFRLDLYHRIADWRVELPPLRARRPDVLHLAAHFLERAGRSRGVAIAGISRAAAEALNDYRWPGNVRQLDAEMRRAALFLDSGELLESTHLSEEIRSAEPGPGSPLKRTLEAAERRAIRRALQACQGDVAAAARELGVGKSTLYRRMKELGT